MAYCVISLKRKIKQQLVKKFVQRINVPQMTQTCLDEQTKRMLETEYAKLSASRRRIMKQLYDKLMEARHYEDELRNARKQLKSECQKKDDALSKLQSSRESGQDTCEVLSVLSEGEIIVRTSAGPRYLTNKRTAVPLSALKPGARVSVSTAAQTIMHALPPAVDPQVFKFAEPGTSANNRITWADVGGLGDEVGLVREAIELPLTHPELFAKVGIEPPKAILLTGPPGTGKTLICQALSNSLNCTFIKLVGSQLIQKYIGESTKLIKEMFAFARQNAPSVLLIDEVDSICGARSGKSGSSDREVARAMLCLLTELDGFHAKDAANDQVKCVFCTNRPRALDPAFLRSGRISRKIQIKLPDAAGRFEILRIHSRGVKLDKGVDFSRIVEQTEGFNGADLRNLITEAGLSAIRAGRGSILMDDMLEAVRVLQKAKTLEGASWDTGRDGFAK